MTRPGQGRVVQLAQLPDGEVSADNFELGTKTIRDLADGEVLTRTLVISLDPVTRLKMRTALEEGDTSPVGTPITSRTLDRVVESRHPSFHPGDLALGWGGWQEYAIQSSAALTPIDHVTDEPWLWLGPLGRPGITAWLGIEHVLHVGPDDTVIVTSAAGAVGNVAAQLAKARGARVIGIAGGPEKCAWLTDEVGLDDAVDYKASDFEEALAKAVPEGATALFECVGGRVMDAALNHLRAHARIALCGMLSRYDRDDGYPYRYLHLLLVNALSLTGFRIDDHPELHGAALDELVALRRSGGLIAKTVVSEGLDSAPLAFVDMLAGRGHGKHLIRLNT